MAEVKDQIIDLLKKQISDFEGKAEVSEVGTVLEVKDGVASINGLRNAMSQEMLEFSAGDEKVYGVALNLDEDQVGAMILGDYEKIKEGDTVKRTQKILSVPVSEKMIGRVINPLGIPMDGKGDIKTDILYPIEKIAPGVITRKSVDTPVQTGIKAIDAMIPIGRGQRELIIGDRQTGKTAVAIDTIINQKGKDLICIYVAIAQKESKVARLVAKLVQEGAMEHTIIVNAAASESAALHYIAPYAGCAIGEYFVDQGKDVLVVYDDLSKQAIAYRQISLILKRPPGREAYPGDIFYAHSRLLERACRLNKDFGGGSLTALPIIETQAGDISAYIPTNVISITDGQIFLESELFYQGIRPALNVGLSVSRVGSAAQTKAMKKVAGPMKLDLAQYRELAAFAQFGSDLDKETQKQLERGKRTVEITKQAQYSPASVANQVVSIYAVTHGYMDDVAVENILSFEKELLKYANELSVDLMNNLNQTGDWNDEIEAQIKKTIENFRQTKDMSQTS
ncbi:MAG: F0F1 ATP synthase subunit alpha [Patescibacteria group bacterium]